MFEVAISVFKDSFPKYFRRRAHWVTAGVATVFFLVALPCVTQGGVYVVNLVDYYFATVGLMLATLIECLLVGWVYG